MRSSIIGIIGAIAVGVVTTSSAANPQLKLSISAEPRNEVSISMFMERYTTLAQYVGATTGAQIRLNFGRDLTHELEQTRARGTDRMIRRWNALTGDHIGQVAMGGAGDPLAAYAGDRGAEVFRACVACHTLTTDEGNRAGPTLHGIFGRRIATLPGYSFSPSLKKLDIVWSPETVSKLFEIGPMIYTPGTKMPEQKIGSAEDRAALVTFLEKVTR